MNLSASLKDLQDFSTHPWITRGARHLPLIASGVLTIALAWELAQFTWLLSGQRPSAPADSTLPVAAASQRRPVVDAQAIADAHLFGLPVAERGDADLSNAPRTQMSLILTGTIASSDPTKGFAIIGESATSSKFYAVGAMIAGTARLHSVFADRVILDRGGRLEALVLPRKSSGGAPMARAPLPPGGPPNQFADNLRRIAETNPSAISEVLRPQPVFANGVQRGYRVYPGRNRQQFAKLGLQPGDLVTAINGASLDDPARGNEVFSTLYTSDRVELTVERNGRTQQLTLNTAQISLPEPSAAEPVAAEPPAIEGTPPVTTDDAATQ